jgi:hypothetical protein
MFTAAHQSLATASPVGLSRPQLEDAVEALAKVEAHAVERRLAFLAAIGDLEDGGVAPEDVNRSRARRSKKSSRKAAKTAKKLTSMPKTRAALAKGEITEEHADAAADAAEETSPEEADDLVGDAKAQPADLFSKRAHDWAGNRRTDEDKKSRHQRHRANREVAIWQDADGMTVLLGKFDPVTGRKIRGELDAMYERMWRADGGRDGKPDAVRTPEQRRADALAELIATHASGATKRPHPKYLGLVRLDYDRITGGAGAGGEATLVDGEALPQSMVDQILCDGAIAGAIFGADGEVLWQGRNVRLATDAQWAQLIARDGGCIGCGASAQYCEAHHIDHWEDLGPTDIDNLVLLCSHDHHLVHDGSHVLVNASDGWQMVRRSAQRRSDAEAA